MTYAHRTKGSARPEGGREAPALGGGSGAARRFPPGGTFERSCSDVAGLMPPLGSGAARPSMERCKP